MRGKLKCRNDVVEGLNHGGQEAEGDEQRSCLQCTGSMNPLISPYNPITFHKPASKHRRLVGHIFLLNHQCSTDYIF